MDEVKEDKFNLQKNSFLTIGSILPRCISFLPKQNKKEKTQQLFIGDARGILYVTDYNIKEAEPEVRSKSQAFKDEISCLDVNTFGSNERLFFSHASNISITPTRQCKDFNKVEVDIPFNIKEFKVIDNKIWTVSNNYLNEYQITNQTDSLSSYDNEIEIKSMLVSNAISKTKQSVLLGSTNKLKMITSGECKGITPLQSDPLSMMTYKVSSYDNSLDKVIFGTSFGSCGILQIQENEAPKILWEDNPDSIKSEIIGLAMHDININGNNETIALRSNGDIDVYTIGNTVLDAVHISKYKTNEILTGVDIGQFKNSNEYDIMLSSYSGLVFSLTPSLETINIVKKLPNQKQMILDIARFDDEVIKLNQLLKEKEEEYNKQFIKNEQAHVKNPYKTKYKFVLVPLEAVYLLTIESEFPLDMIVFKSEVKIDIVEIITKEISFNIINNNDKGLLATCKMRGDIHILELKIRTYEGNKDDLICTLIPFNTPKTSYIVEIPIKSLPLNQRIGENENDTWEKTQIQHFKDTDDKFINKLIMKGNFSTSEFNQILSSIMPNISDKTSKDELIYYFEDSYLNTVLYIEIANGLCIIKTTFVNSLIIIKEQITKEANNRCKELNFEGTKIEPMSVFKILQQLHPMIENNFNLETKHKLLQAFSQLDLSEINNMPDEYKDMIDNKEKIEKDYKQRTLNLDYMKSIVKNLMKSISKVRSINNLEDKYEKIERLFEDYSLEKMADIFMELKNI